MNRSNCKSSLKWTASHSLIAFAIAILGGCAERSASESSESLSVVPVSNAIRVPSIFVEETPRFRYDLPVSNSTSRHVRFVKIQRSCTCASAELLKMQLVPGEETALRLDLDLTGRKGPQRFVCTLIEDNGNEWTCSVETTLYERARFAGTGLTHFGMVDPNTEQTRETEFMVWGASLDAIPETVAFGTESDRMRFTASPARVEKLDDDIFVRTFPLQITVTSTLAPGLNQAAVLARYEHDGKQRAIHNEVTWNVASLYTIAPAQTYFGQVTSGTEPVERKALIRRTDGQPLLVKSMKSSSPAVTPRLAPQDSDGSKGCLVLILDPKELTRTLTGEVSVETNHPLQPILTVPFAAILALSD